MLEKAVSFYSFPPAIDRVFQVRDQIVDRVFSTANSLRSRLTSIQPTIAEVARLDLAQATDMSHGRLNPEPKKPISDFAQATHLLSLEVVNELGSSVAPDSEVTTGETIQSGQLEMVAEIIHDRIQAERSNANKGWKDPQSPISLGQIEPKTIGKVINAYIIDRPFWRSSLEGYDPETKPIKQSALDNLPD